MQILETYADEFLVKYKRISKLVNDHGPTVGNYRENILRNFLANLLPNRFSVKTGFIFNNDIEKASRQIDILIIDENIPHAYFFKEQDFAIVHPSSVVCGIEVKSNLKKGDFENCCKKAFDYRTVCESGPFFCFAFDSNSRNLLENLQEWCNAINVEDDIKYYAHSFYILNNGLLQLIYEPGNPWGYYFLGNYNEESVNTNIVTAFLASIMKFCQYKVGIDANPYEQYGLENSIILHSALRYGNKKMEI